MTLGEFYEGMCYKILSHIPRISNSVLYKKMEWICVGERSNEQEKTIKEKFLSYNKVHHNKYSGTS